MNKQPNQSNVIPNSIGNPVTPQYLGATVTDCFAYARNDAEESITKKMLKNGFFSSLRMTAVTKGLDTVWYNKHEGIHLVFLREVVLCNEPGRGSARRAKEQCVTTDNLVSI